jgi:hypothetical protein
MALDVLDILTQGVAENLFLLVNEIHPSPSNIPDNHAASATESIFNL